MTFFITVVTSLFAGFFNSISGVFQRKGSGKPKPDELYKKDIILKTSKNSVWQIGVLTEALAAVLEVVALYFGSLIIVEPLLMTNLIFLMVILQLKYKIAVSPREWSGVIAICLGISLFLIVSNPKSGVPSYGLIWLAPTIIVATLITTGAIITRRLKQSEKRGAAGAITAGLSLGLTAALTRLAMVELHSGIYVFFTHWPIYALIISAVVSVITIQVGYASGPLKITQPVLEVVSPIVSILIVLLIFRHSISMTPLAILLESVGFIIAAGGVVVLGSSARLIKAETYTSLHIN